MIPCSKLYSLQTSITLSIREVSTPCYKTATEWEFQVIKLYLIGRGFSGPGVAIKRPCFNFFHSLPHLSLYWSTKTKNIWKTFSCKSKNDKKKFKRNTMKRANNLNKQHCRTNTINDIYIYKTQSNYIAKSKYNRFRYWNNWNLFRHKNTFIISFNYSCIPLFVYQTKNA